MGTKNKISDLKNHLMMQMERLNDLDITNKDDAKTLELELKRSKEVANVAQAITNIAKVEVEYIEVLTKHGANYKSEFFEIGDRTPRLTPAEEKMLAQDGRNRAGN